MDNVSAIWYQTRMTLCLLVIGFGHGTSVAFCLFAHLLVLRRSNFSFFHCPMCMLCISSANPGHLSELERELQMSHAIASRLRGNLQSQDKPASAASTGREHREARNGQEVRQWVTSHSEPSSPNPCRMYLSGVLFCFVFAFVFSASFKMVRGFLLVARELLLLCGDTKRLQLPVIKQSYCAKWFW